MKSLGCFKPNSSVSAQRSLSLKEYRKALSWSKYLVASGGEIRGGGEEEEEEWSADMSRLLIGSKFATGRHSRVYHGVYKEREVAVKLISQPEEDEALAASLEQQFNLEVALLLRLRHPNIIRKSSDESDEIDESDQIKCQICCQSTHSAIGCPFMYSKCRRCDGIRRVWEGNTRANPHRRFLRCQHFNCAEFQWLDEAVKLPPPRQHSAKGCAKCGSRVHWAKDCPEEIGELCGQFQGSLKLDQMKRRSM